MQETIKKNKIGIGIIVVTIFVSLPLFLTGIEGRFGQDLGFHLMRIEGLAAELQNGIFPVKMESLWMEGYGYPVSVYYGDVLLYFPAILRLLGVSVVTSYKIFLSVINLLSCVLAYWGFHVVFRKKDLAFVAMTAYVTATYRMTNLYLRAAVGEYCAMMFLPVVMAAIYLVYTEDLTDRSKRIKTGILLALGMTGLIGTHILTTEVTVIVMALVALLLWKKTFSLPVMRTYVLAVGETIVLNLYFIVPFLHCYLQEDTYIRHTVSELRRIQQNGITWRRYLDFFRDPFMEGAGAGERLMVTPGPVLLFAFAVAVGICLKKKDKKIFLYTIITALLLFMASAYFPWDGGAQKFHLLNVMAQIQFPWRYIGIATVFLSLLLGCGIEYLQHLGAKKAVITMVFLITGCMCIVFLGFYRQSSQRVNYVSREDLNTYDMGFVEYLPYGTDREAFSHQLEYSAGVQAKMISRKGTSMTIACHTDDAASTLSFPVIHYIGYQVRDEQGKVYQLERSENNLVQISPENNYDGKLYLEYKQPWYWGVAEGISLIGLVGTLWVLKRIKES